MQFCCIEQLLQQLSSCAAQEAFMPGPATGPLSYATRVLAAVCLFAPTAFAQTSTAPPPTQDQQLRNQLGLGNASGCHTLLRVANDGTDVAAELQRLGNEIGNELRAICGPSAINSASSLGGGFSTLQPTKTVTQFGVARRRLDQRLPTPAKPKPPPALGVNFLQVGPSPVFTMGGEDLDGVGVFGAVTLDGRTRTETPYESGYDSDVTGISGGIDYLRGGALIGGWIEQTRQDGTFATFTPLLPDALARQTFTVFDRQPGAISTVCGGLSTPGSFEQRGTRFGGFVGWAAGAGFLDATASWGRREHEYSRSVCAIEAQGELELAGGVLRDPNLPGNVIDDIFAGTISGLSVTRESTVSVRTGANLGERVIVGPRAIFTVQRAARDAYVESGRSTVANTVVPVFGTPVNRTLGGPVGLELAFDDGTRTSIVLDAGGELAFRLGAVVPHVAGYWRREFNDDYHVMNARLAQDLRATPTTFDIGQDAFDPNALLLGFGVTAYGGSRVTARVDVNRLAGDRLFDSTAVVAQARVRF
jgi:hypothetical protein